MSQTDEITMNPTTEELAMTQTEGTEERRQEEMEVESENQVAETQKAQDGNTSNTAAVNSQDAAQTGASIVAIQDAVRGQIRHLQRNLRYHLCPAWEQYPNAQSERNQFQALRNRRRETRYSDHPDHLT